MKIHPKTLHSMIRSGKIAASIVGSRYRISDYALREYLDLDSHVPIGIESVGNEKAVLAAQSMALR